VIHLNKGYAIKGIKSITFPNGETIECDPTIIHKLNPSYAIKGVKSMIIKDYKNKQEYEINL
jgi:hypothetical protein